MKKPTILTLLFFFTITASAIAAGTAPSKPSNLRSLTHSISLPSSNTVIKVVWTASTDPDDDLIGYGIKWDNFSDTKLTAGIHKSTSAESDPLADGTWYFHVRAIDSYYNSSDTVHLGPFIIKTESEPVMGDINGDDVVNLVDAILGLQVCISLDPGGTQLAGDVNSDDKIGLEDVIYILQKVSGISGN